MRIIYLFIYLLCLFLKVDMYINNKKSKVRERNQKRHGLRRRSCQQQQQEAQSPAASSLPTHAADEHGSLVIFCRFLLLLLRHTRYFNSDLHFASLYHSPVPSLPLCLHNFYCTTCRRVLVCSSTARRCGVDSVSDGGACPCCDGFRSSSRRLNPSDSSFFAWIEREREVLFLCLNF